MSEKNMSREDNALNLLNGQLSNTSAKNQYVTFEINEEIYGIDIMLVQEMMRYQKPTRVFNSNPIIKGLINFRGTVIPIIDMHKKFDIAEIEYDRFTVVIVFKVKEKTIGIIVNRVSDIISPAENEIQEVSKEFADDIKTKHLKGIAKDNSNIVLLLDEEKILSFEELERLDNDEKIQLE